MMRHPPPFSGRREASRGLTFITAFAVMFTALGSSAQPADDELSRLQTENAALRQQVTVLQEELAALRTQFAELSRDNNQLETQAQQLENQAEQLEEQTQQLRTLAGVTTDGQIVAEQATRIKQITDQKTNQTVVRFGPEPLDLVGSPGEVFFSVVYARTADAPDAAVESVSVFIQTAKTRRIFQDRDKIDFVIDGGEALLLAPTGYDITTRRTGLAGKSRSERSDETVTFTFDRATFGQLAGAKSLTIEAGNVTLTFDRDGLAALRALDLRLAEGSPAAAD